MSSGWNDAPTPDLARYDFRRDIPYDDGASDDPMRTLWLSAPQGHRDFATVVWIHGGGFTLDQHECPPALYNGRRAVVEVRHRVVPHVKAPAYLRDGAAAVAWVLRHIVAFGGDPQRVVVGGMSAGAYLAALVCMAPQWLRPYGFGPRSVAGLILVSGQMTTHFQVKQDLGYTGDRYLPVVDELAPLHHLAPELPPILLITGDPARDIAARPEENAFMAASLRAMGHPHVVYHALSGHDHGAAFRSSDSLIERFLDDIMEGRQALTAT